jgi:hypothetical protein
VTVEAILLALEDCAVAFFWDGSGWYCSGSGWSKVFSDGGGSLTV